jgi:hypothetical protein
MTPCYDADEQAPVAQSKSEVYQKQPMNGDFGILDFGFGNLELGH